MSNPPLERAVSFLIDRQDDDGHWRDYELPPGFSEAWTTACAGLALLRVAGPGAETGRAVRTLLATMRPEGWGYNSRTACDADTTSWVIRFLAAAGALEGVAPEVLLTPYITSAGRVRTFSSTRFGTWAEEHDEVAPLAGMALLASGSHTRAERIRETVVKATQWRPFWWRCRSYVCARNLEFLSLSGGIPREIREREAATLASLPPPASAFDLAHRRLAAACLELDGSGGELFDAQQADGGWPPSAELLVPSHNDGSWDAPQADHRRVMTTAIVMSAQLTALAGR